MGCLDTTPWSLMNHPFTVNRLRVTAGGGTSQSTGEWVVETTSSIEICGSLGRGTERGSTGMQAEDLVNLAGGQFKTGDQYFVCHTDCDVSLNDLLEVYEDTAGSSKTYWRIVVKLKSLVTFENLRGYGQQYFLIRLENR